MRDRIFAIISQMVTPCISDFILKKNLETGLPDSDSISTNSSSCLGILILFTWEIKRENEDYNLVQ